MDERKGLRSGRDVVPSSAVRGEIVAIASRRTRAFGGSSLAELVSFAAGRGIAVSEQQAREAFPTAEFLDDDWFLLPGERRNRLLRLTHRILAVASPLDVPTIRAGVCRTYPAERRAFVPPESVMTSLYREHSGFVVDSRSRVSSARGQDGFVGLGAGDRVFVEIFRSSWVGVLERESLRAEWLARGMASRTFRTRVACSAILDHAPGGIWFLRGTRISAVTAVALRRAKAAAQASTVIRGVDSDEDEV